ncbi:hypothetical protein AB6831_02045 [Carnobacterium divergens]
MEKERMEVKINNKMQASVLDFLGIRCNFNFYDREWIRTGFFVKTIA